jgi:hypothetical protein
MDLYPTQPPLIKGRSKILSIYCLYLALVLK